RAAGSRSPPGAGGSAGRGCTPRPGPAGHRESLRPSAESTRRTRRPLVLRRMSEALTLQRWICESCGYIYDPEDGDPDGGIPAGTAFEDIPVAWFWPVGGARKRDFVLLED